MTGMAQTWRETVERLREQIVRLDPEWTDHNPHDPGITILEMMAWMQQNQLYHAEQIGEEHRRKYGKLLGIERQMRRPGRTLVTVQSEEAVYLEAGTRFYADGICFESREGQVAAERIFQRMETFGADTRTVLEGEWMWEGKGIHLLPFGENPRAGSGFEIKLRGSLEPGKRHRLFMKTGPAYENRRKNVVDEEAYDGHGYYPLAEIRMEYLTGTGWQAVDVERDETYGMVQDGSICFSLGVPMRQEDYRLRFLLERSDYLWAPCITRMSLAMVEVWQQETVKGTVEFFGKGLPRQKFDCEMRDLCQERLVVESSREDEPERLAVWTQVEDFDNSTPEDRHYRLENGWLIFGDGFCGRMPEGRIRLSKIVRTLGKAGNVKAGAIDRMDDGVSFTVINEDEVFGGMDEESVDEALLRYASGKRKKRRAVTLEDYEELVMAAPGLRLESCVAFCRDAKKREIAVAVKPESDDGQGELNEAYRKNLYRYLEEKRMIGTRILILSPVYCPVSISCTCYARVQYRNAGQLVEEWIRQWMQGRSFGQGISYGELIGSLEALPWILEVPSLSVVSGRQGRRNSRGDLLIPPDGLMVLKQTECQVITGMGHE